MRSLVGLGGVGLGLGVGLGVGLWDVAMMLAVQVAAAWRGLWDGGRRGRVMGWKWAVSLSSDAAAVVGVIWPQAPVVWSPLLRRSPEEKRRRVWLPPAAMWVSFGGRVDVLVVSEGGRGTGWGAEMSSLWFRPSWPEPLEPRAWRRSIVVVF
jgi:hypothetical protein